METPRRLDLGNGLTIVRIEQLQTSIRIESRGPQTFVPELARLGADDTHAPTGLLAAPNYPAPIVDHSKARTHAIDAFKRMKS